MNVYGQIKKVQLELYTEATKPSASTIPYQVIFTTDTFKVYISNGTSWIDINAATSLPTGTVFAWAGSDAAVPATFSLCDGGTLSRTTEAGLFAVIGITHGEGNGTTTFNKPDYRGRFLRGADLTAGRDPDAASRTAMNTGGNTGDNVGSVQLDAFKSHSHDFTLTSDESGTNKATFGSTDASTQSTDPTGGSETRPLNAYVNYIIKL